MTENELDQLLNKWRTPDPSSSLRVRVMAGVPERERRGWGRPLRWGLAIAVASGMLAVGMQGGGSAIDNLADGIHSLHNSMFFWLDQHWTAHVFSAFRGSNLKVYVDGQLVPEAECGGEGAMMWVQLPGEAKYEVALRPPETRPAVSAGRFHGHNLEFQAGGRSVRVEADRSVGLGTNRRVYLLEPAAGK
jgi:hypothetical protein